MTSNRRKARLHGPRSTAPAKKDNTAKLAYAQRKSGAPIERRPVKLALRIKPNGAWGYKFRQLRRSLRRG